MSLGCFVGLQPKNRSILLAKRNYNVFLLLIGLWVSLFRKILQLNLFSSRYHEIKYHHCQ